VDYLLKQAVQHATAVCPSLATKTVSPHVVRHTTAMHLLQAGVDIATIALWLGHESIETTHVYLQADLAMAEKALGKLDPLGGEWTRFHADDPLLAFLASL
jgi:site-specific recombinase XerD